MMSEDCGELEKDEVGPNSCHVMLEYLQALLESSFNSAFKNA